MKQYRRIFPALYIFLAGFLLLVWGAWITTGGCASTVQDISTTTNPGTTSTTTTTSVTTTTKSPITMELLAQKTGGFPYNGLGVSLTGADLNGDGKAEYAIGAPSVAHSGSPEVGTIYIYSGSGTLLYQKYGKDAYMKLGITLAVGDYNGDNKYDLFAGTGGTGEKAWAYIYNGETGNVLDGIGQESAGTSLACGDLDADGKDEFVTGAPLYGSNGAVFILADGEAAYAKSGAGWQPKFGLSAACGDIDGDGYADYIIGSTNNYFVYSGKDNSYLYGKQGQIQSTTFASALAAADIDGDGICEVIASDPYADSPTSAEAGAVYVYSGNPPQLVFERYGEVSGSRFGSCLATGDVDGDGVADIIVGAPETSLTGDGANGWGAVYLFSGGSGTQIWQQYSDPSTRHFGVAVAAADINGDGRAEVLVSDPWADVGGKLGCGLVNIYKKQ